MSSKSPVVGTNVYEDEVKSYDILSVSVPAFRYANAGEDQVSFKIYSKRGTMSAESVEAKDSSESSNTEIQTVWRTFADFKKLHENIQRETSLGFATPLPYNSWAAKLAFSSESNAEYKRALLEEYLKAVLADKKASATKAIRTFLRAAERPDWPDAVGDIDLMTHDLPHDSSATEWWYYNIHFEDAEGNNYCIFVAFFRVLKHIDENTSKKSWAHALNWAMIDVTNKRYIQQSLLDPDSPAIIKKQIESGKAIKDRRLQRAYIEILDKGNVPLPDRMFTDKKGAKVALDKLDLDFEGAQLTKNANGEYVLVGHVPGKQDGFALTLTPKKKPIRHGLDGVVKGHDGDDMFYYFIPRCDVRGTFTLNGVTKSICNAEGWYDHEFGGVKAEDDVKTMDYAWSWASAQLDNGYELSVALLVDPRSKPMKEMERRAVVIDPQGNRIQPSDLEFVGSDVWTSVRSFNSYPTTWHLRIPSAGIDLVLKAPFSDQEFFTLIAKPAFWEGRMDVTGTHNGKPVKGNGFLEYNGFQTLSELDSFFKAVGAETRRAVMEVYPDKVTEEHAVNLIADKDTKHYIEGVDLDVFHEGIVAPVRYITDMGGKSWRSYGALACMDVVGGDSRNFVRWLSMPEFMHVGSLIIDDIEDKSTLRRGVPCAHIKYGEAVAINSGTAAFFQGQQMLIVPGLGPEKMNKIYDFYFLALRAGHAGQALDIAGLDHIMDDVIERGDAAFAEQRVTATHRLKTAVPAASLARMGALVGGGTDEQITAIGNYYESVGIAFQIMDDVLNLRGIYSSKADKLSDLVLKSLGEDITAGKVTFPVVKAIGILPKKEMRALWDIIKTKPEDRATIDHCIKVLEDCGAIDACVEHAERLVNESFYALDPIVPDSFSKLMLRSFGWFVTERQ